MEAEQDMKKIVGDFAAENFRNGLNCSECVFDALQRSGALKAPKEAIAMCIGFGGGIGLSGNTCGAFLAAVMANGAAYGRPDPWAVAPEQRAAELAAKYYRRYNKMTYDFIDKQGALACRDICAPFGDWHGKERRKNCLRLIAATAVMAYEYLLMTQAESFALPYGENIGGVEQ